MGGWGMYFDLTMPKNSILLNRKYKIACDEEKLTIDAEQIKNDSKKWFVWLWK